MGRTRWLATGVAVGVGGTLWVEQRVRRRIQQTVDRLAPSALTQGVVSGAHQVSDRIKSAVESGRAERARLEAELRERFSDLPIDERASTVGAVRGSSARPVGAESSARPVGAESSARPVGAENSARPVGAENSARPAAGSRSRAARHGGPGRERGRRHEQARR